MQKPSVRCALLAAMIAKHGWGSPIPEEQLLSIAALDPSEYPRGRAVVDELRDTAYVSSRGKRGIELDTGGFGELAEILYHECQWEPYEIRLRLKHYEGWNRHEWA